MKKIYVVEFVGQSSEFPFENTYCPLLIKATSAEVVRKNRGYLNLVFFDKGRMKSGRGVIREAAVQGGRYDLEL